MLVVRKFFVEASYRVPMLGLGVGDFVGGCAEDLGVSRRDVVPVDAGTIAEVLVAGAGAPAYQAGGRAGGRSYWMRVGQTGWCKKTSRVA